MSNRKQPTLNFVKGVYGDNWRKLREERGKTVRDFAKQVYIASPTISSIENEKLYPTVEQVIQYQKEFNVSLDYLVGLTKTKDIDNNMITMYTGLSEGAIEYFHNLDGISIDLINRMLCQMESDNPLMEQEYNLFSILIKRVIDYIDNSVEAEINRNNTIRAAELANIYGSDFGIEQETETVKLRLKAKGYGIYKTDTVLEAQSIEIERLFSKIIKSIVKELVDEQQTKE